MITIQIGTRTFKAPTNWAAIPATQAEKLARFIGHEVFDHTKQYALTRYQQEELIIEWLRVPIKFWDKITMQPHQFAWLLKSASWIANPATPMQLSFESIDHNGKKYFLPEYNYKTATALEIAWANVAWLNYTSNCHPEPPQRAGEGPDNIKPATLLEIAERNTALNELLSVILRPIRPDIDTCQTDPNWNGDKRIPLANHICEAIQEELATLPEATKLLALRYFEAMNMAFVTEFDVLFGAGSTEGTGIAPAYPEGFGWEASLRRIAKEGTFGTYEKVCQTNGRQIWMYEYQKHLELEAEIANQKLQNEKK